MYWDYAMTIRLQEIVYLHCHQQGGSISTLDWFSNKCPSLIINNWCSVPPAVDSGGTVVLVSQDGIQRPPFRFPRGGHLLQFLSCLENGLLPRGQLDPPLWSQRGKVRSWSICKLQQNQSINQFLSKTMRLENCWSVIEQYWSSSSGPVTQAVKIHLNLVHCSVSQLLF